MAAPMLEMVFCICTLTPLPISTMAMTDATAMMMPRQVRAERKMFRRKARKAVVSVMTGECMTRAVYS